MAMAAAVARCWLAVIRLVWHYWHDIVADEANKGTHFVCAIVAARNFTKPCRYESVQLGQIFQGFTVLVGLV